MSKNTDMFFKEGTLTTIMDGGAGSSAKGKLASYIGSNSDKWSFCVNAFMSNAGHTVILDDGKEYFYQVLNSVAHLGKYERCLVGAGAVIELPALMRELEENNLDEKRFGIHPLVSIVQDKDVSYERGTTDFEGNSLLSLGLDNLSIGSTAHGVGSARARRMLRRSDVLLARDIPELKPFLTDVPKEILARLNKGECGLLEVAQGYQLSLMSNFYPRVTSRNCTLSAALDDIGVPPKYSGNVILNFRTFPIRVSSQKYLDRDTLKILTEKEKIEALEKDPNSVTTVVGDSGSHYPDQEETNWSHVTHVSGIKSFNPDAEIKEQTSLTKLTRRVFTFSKMNVAEAIEYNQPANGNVYMAINFMNYVDHTIFGCNKLSDLTERCYQWLRDNLTDEQMGKTMLVGTGPKQSEMISFIP